MANNSYYPDRALQSHIQSLLYFYRGNGYCGPLKKNELFKVSDGLLELQRGLTGDRKLAGTDSGSYMQNDSFLGAYLLYYWPVSFMQIQHAALSVKSTLDALIQKRLESGSKTFRILDLGSGPGPASAALCDLVQSCLGDKSKLPLDLTLLDYSSKALGLAKKMFSRDFSNVNVEIESCNFEKGDLNLESKKFDLVITNHCLNELWKNKKNCVELRAAFLEKACESLEDDGLLFMCEPALLLTSRNIIALAQEMGRRGFDVVSPCCLKEKCPALETENQTCHAEISWKPVEPVASIAAKAKLDRNSVKMTFFVMKKNCAAEFADPAGCAGNTVNGGNAEDAGKSQITQHEIKGVVVSDGMVNKAGRMRFVVCNGKERITVSAKVGDAAADEKKFFTLKRYDYVEIKNPEIRGDAKNISYGVDKGTQIFIKRFK